MLLSGLTGGGGNWKFTPSLAAFWDLWEDLWISGGFQEKVFTFLFAMHGLYPAEIAVRSHAEVLCRGG